MSPPPPPSADELELKQQVTSTLARQGVLDKIKAQLRAAVFHVMNDHEPATELVVSATKLQAFKLEGAELALAVVEDFLEFFQLEHSLSVLRVEASVQEKNNRVATSALLADLLETSGLERDGGAPLLIQLLQQQQQHKGSFAVDAKEHRPGVKAPQHDDTELDDQQPYQHLYTRSNNSKSDVTDRSMHDDVETNERVLGVALHTKRNAERLASVTTTTTTTNDFDKDDHHEHVSVQRVEAAAATTLHAARSNHDDAERDRDDEAAESIASDSELDESIAEDQSTSLNYSQDYESASRDDASDVDVRASTRVSIAATTRAFASSTIREDSGDNSDKSSDSDTHEQNVHDNAGSLTSDTAAVRAPPAPATLLSLPSLAAPNSRSRAILQDDDEFDEELEAARLSSLDAKLKAMEAEDETGTLQQLKASLQMELQRDDEAVQRTNDNSRIVAAAATTDDDDEPDGYGSDFDEEDEVISEVSDSDEIESVAELSANEDDESVGLSTLQPKIVPRDDAEPDASAVLARLDKLVDSESALNSYDYIEDVEKDW